jgi:hypothetical protein
MLMTNPITQAPNFARRAALVLCLIPLLDLAGLAQQTVSGTKPLSFVPITPCRLVDTRAGQGKSGPFGPPALAAGQARTIPVPAGGCGVPAAAAYSAHFTVVTPAGKGVGWFVAWQDGVEWPGTVVLNASQGGIIGNTAVVRASTNGAIQVLATDDTDLVIDLYGYYIEGSMTYAGTWRSGTTYNTGDTVLYNGSSYASLINSNTGSPPDTNSDRWGLVARQGETGLQGLSLIHI